MFFGRPYARNADGPRVKDFWANLRDFFRPKLRFQIIPPGSIVIPPANLSQSGRDALAQVIYQDNRRELAARFLAASIQRSGHHQKRGLMAAAAVADADALMAALDPPSPAN